jgi:glycosyltransferase involved in cell wall biosynthesis
VVTVSRRGTASGTTDDARLTIGMPVYNNARTIRRALESLLAQTYRNFRILISDDVSTDETANVCEEYAARDSRIRVIRQPTNLNYGNFRYLLQKARTPLFMFAAGDDRWHPEYVARMIEALDANPRAVCAVSQVSFTTDTSVLAPTGGTAPLTADPATNIAAFLSAADDNSRMYGVLRTDVARRAFPDHDFFAFDWAMSIGTLREGIHVQVPEVLLWRDRTDPARYVEYARRDAANGLSRIFPILPLTGDLIGRLRIPLTLKVVRLLARLNVRYHLLYMRRYHPRGAVISQGLVNVLRFPVRAARRLSPKHTT